MRGAEFTMYRFGDGPLNSLAIVLFSFALGTVAIVVPLLAVSIGYSAAQVGLLVAVSAIAQIIMRMFMGAMMRRVSDKVLLIAAGIMIALSAAMIAFSTMLMVFVGSQLIQGAARAFFWTSSQTHAVRSSSTAIGALRMVNLAAGVGALLGPALAGPLFEVSTSLPLIVGAVAGILAVVPAALLIRYPPFASNSGQDRHSGVRLWLRPGVNSACWMNASAGAWKSLMDSYVPVALSLAGQSPAIIGILTSIANSAVLVGSAIGGWLHRKGTRASVVAGVLATGLGLAALGPFAGMAVAAAASLALSGTGAGLLQTVGPAIAAEGVHPEERGEVLALTGIFRASALLVTPFGMAGMVAALPVGTALLFAGVVVAAPAAIKTKRTRSK